MTDIDLGIGQILSDNVAIIVSNYNYGEYVLEAIDSARFQDYEGDVRVYVVDDGSTDDSWDKISSITEKLPTVTLEKPYYTGAMEIRQADSLYAYRIDNSGASTARNVAIWEAWEWASNFAILDADDEMHDNKISSLVPYLEEYSEIGVVYADYKIHRSYGGKNYIKHEYKYPYSTHELRRHCIVHSGAVISKRYLRAVVNSETLEFYDSNLHGPGSQQFIGCTEDYDLWLRLSEVCVMTHVPIALSFVRETGNNQSLKMTDQIFNANMQKISSKT